MTPKPKPRAEGYITAMPENIASVIVPFKERVSDVTFSGDEP